MIERAPNIIQQPDNLQADRKRAKNRVFITGITGLLGVNLVNELLSGGYQITGLTRNKNAYKGITSESLQLIQGSLFDDFSDILKNIDYVVHVAAQTATNLSDYRSYHKVNFRATCNLFNSAAKAGVRKFIFISTANTIGYGSKHKPGSEEIPAKKPFTRLFYVKSKLEAEKFLLENKNKTDVLILNPTFIIGGNDYKPTSGKIILMGLNSKIVFFPPGGKNFVHVKDVVSAIIKSFDNGTSGEKYLIANENIRYKDFFRMLRKISHQKQLLVQIPDFLFMFLGIAGEIMRLIKIKTSLSITNMQILRINTFYDNKKSTRELKISYHSTEQAIKEAVSFFKSH